MAYSNRGIVSYGKGEWDHALTEYDRAIEIDPKFTLAYSSRAQDNAAKRD